MADYVAVQFPTWAFAPDGNAIIAPSATVLAALPVTYTTNPTVAATVAPLVRPSTHSPAAPVSAKTTVPFKK